MRKYTLLIIVVGLITSSVFIFSRTNKTFAEQIFTVTLQEGLNNYSGTTDTYINTYSKLTNYGSATILALYPYNSVKPIIRFDLSAIPANAIINSATLSMYASSWGGSSGNNKNFIYQILDKNWQESQANWNIYSTSNNWSTAGLGYGTDIASSPSVTIVTGYAPAPMWVDLNVATLVQNWVNGTYPNYGVAYSNTYTSGGGGPTPQFYSSEYTTDTALRPKLVINYTVPGDPDIEAPSIPANLSATPVSISQINLTWSASTDNVGVTGYRIYRNGNQIATTTAISYSDNGLTPNTNYSYIVSAYDAVGNESGQSNTVNTATLPDTQAPSVSLTAPSQDAMVLSTISVNASASDDVGVVGVQFKLDGVSLDAEDLATPYSITWDTITATNGTHILTAVARDSAGNTTTSVTVNVTVNNPVPDTQSPSVPSGLSATAVSETQINLSWNVSTDNVGVTGYSVYRGGNQIATSATASYSDTGLIASTTYSYTISAFDLAENNSSQSQSAEATTFAPPPPDTTAPGYTNLSVTSCDTSSCTLSWNASGDDGYIGTATNYDIRYSTSFINESSWISAIPLTGEPAPQIAGTLQTFVVSNLTASSTYYFAIKTSDEAGNVSILSNSPQGITPPATSGNFVTTFQEGLNGYIGTTDTNVNTYAKTTNYGSATSLTAASYNATKPLFQFDLSSIPVNAVVNSATLSFYASSWGGAAGSNQNAIYRVLDKNWVESEANWNIYSTGNNWTTSGLGSGTDYGSPVFTSLTGWVPAGPMWVNFSVATLAQNWVNGTYQNHGIVYSTNGGPQPTFYSSEYTIDPSLRPKLVVDYTVPGEPTPEPEPWPLPQPGPFSFTLTGDIGASTLTTASLQNMASQNSAFTLALGDLSYSQITPESAWCNYIKGIFGENYQFLLEVGNHESPEKSGPDGNIDNFAQCMPTHFPITGNYGREYYFDYPYGATSTPPLARFIMLNASLPETYLNGSEAQARVATYIDEARASGIKWIVVGMHMLCPTLGNKSCTSYSASPGPDLFNFLVNKKVDLIVHGHDHNYQRTKQLALGPNCLNIPVEDGVTNPVVADLDCIADDDDSLVKGAGTVIIISGRTPNYQYGYEINLSDPEAPYFRTAQYTNYGYTKVSITESQLTSEFITTGTSGGGPATFSDTFTITE